MVFEARTIYSIWKSSIIPEENNISFLFDIADVIAQFLLGKTYLLCIYYKNKQPIYNLVNETELHNMLVTCAYKKW